jgi:hypothetical protein
MKALRSPSNSGSDTGRGVRRAAARLPPILLGLGFLAGSVPAAELPAAAEEPVLSVWKVKEARFSYRSSIAIYSCRAIQDRIVSIFRAIGARDDLQVSLSGCDTFVNTPGPSVDFPSADFPSQQTRTGFPTSSDPFPTPSERFRNRPSDRGQLVSVYVRVLMPTEVTPEVVNELDRDKSRRELVSRVTGDPTARLNVPVAFPATWQSVTLSHATIGLDPEECELVEQMSNTVLRQLGVRVVRRSRSCDRDRVSRIPPQLTVEVLKGVPIDPGHVFEMPPEGTTEPPPDPSASAPAAPEAKPAEPATTKPPQ